MIAWEYAVHAMSLYPSINAAGELNRYGRDGWELVSMAEARNEQGHKYTVAIFKRPKSD
jgi:hypothetical protein